MRKWKIRKESFHAELQRKVSPLDPLIMVMRLRFEVGTVLSFIYKQHYKVLYSWCGNAGNLLPNCHIVHFCSVHTCMYDKHQRVPARVSVRSYKISSTHAAKGSCRDFGVTIATPLTCSLIFMFLHTKHTRADAYCFSSKTPSLMQWNTQPLIRGMRVDPQHTLSFTGTDLRHVFISHTTIGVTRLSSCK